MSFQKTSINVEHLWAVLILQTEYIIINHNQLFFCSYTSFRELFFFNVSKEEGCLVPLAGIYTDFKFAPTVRIEKKHSPYFSDLLTIVAVPASPSNKPVP